MILAFISRISLHQIPLQHVTSRNNQPMKCENVHLCVHLSVYRVHINVYLYVHLYLYLYVHLYLYLYVHLYLYLYVHLYRYYSDVPGKKTALVLVLRCINPLHKPYFFSFQTVPDHPNQFRLSQTIPDTKTVTDTTLDYPRPYHTRPSQTIPYHPRPYQTIPDQPRPDQPRPY